MKIKSVNISSFGGLKNKQIDFINGFNVVYGDNENGKTTLMSFIKMMFYGTERGSAQISKNLRKKYTPWDNSGMAGSIDFENAGRNYRIERIFGSSNSSDKVTLIDLDLGNRENVTADIGNKLFGLSSAAFERSIFVGQFGFPENNSIAEGEINSKLSNLTLTGDQSISFDEVNKRLETAKNNLTTKRGVGVYDKNVSKYRELTEKSETANLMQKELSEKQQKSEQARAAIENLQNKCKELKKKIDSEQDFRNAEKFKELLNLKDKLNALNQGLKLNDGNLIDEMFLRKIEFCLSKIEASNQKIEAKKNEAEILEINLQLALNPSPDITPEKAEELKTEIENLEIQKAETENKISRLQQLPKPKDTVFFILLIIGFLLWTATVPLYFVNALLGGGLMALGAVLMIMAFITRSKKRREFSANSQEIIELKLTLNQKISQITAEKANLNAINTALNSNAGIIENQKKRLNECKNEILEIKSENQENLISLTEVYSRFKKTDDINEITASLNEIRKIALEQKEIKQNINYIIKDIGNISYDEARAKLEKTYTNAEDIDFAALKTEYENSNSMLTELASALATLNAEIKAIKENISNIDSLNSQLVSLKETIQSQKNYCDAIDIASEVLQDSFIEVRKSFGSVLEKRASEIFQGLTGGKYNGMNISKSFEITVEKADAFGTKEIDYLSSGTADQAYLSLRLAVCELMAQNDNRLPVLLDDALAQYDDTRTKTALEFLKQYSLDGQIILFTCHNSVLNSAKSSGANEIII